MFARNETDEHKIDNFVERLINNSSAAKSNNVDVDLVEGQKFGPKLRFDATWAQCYKTYFEGEIWKEKSPRINIVK